MQSHVKDGEYVGSWVGGWVGVHCDSCIMFSSPVPGRLIWISCSV